MKKSLVLRTFSQWFMVAKAPISDIRTIATFLPVLHFFFWTECKLNWLFFHSILKIYIGNILSSRFITTQSHIYSTFRLKYSSKNSLKEKKLTSHSLKRLLEFSTERKSEFTFFPIHTLTVQTVHLINILCI